MDPELYKAAKKGYIDALGKFSPHQILIGISPGKNTALHIAACNGHVGFIEKLIEILKADIEVGWPCGLCYGNQFLRSVNREGNTVLHDAARGGHDSVVALLLKEDYTLAQVKNCHGETALFKAAEEGHSTIVKRLLLVMPDEGYIRNDGQTPLHRAVFRQHKGMSPFLFCCIGPYFKHYVNDCDLYIYVCVSMERVALTIGMAINVPLYMAMHLCLCVWGMHPTMTLEGSTYYRHGH
ncbi:hypothetical protein SUGI_0433610 [Cryptomeria japonica]|nr:hypothetical protein SUGI_0433610 [Cryptomeria japonica]